MKPDLHFYGECKNLKFEIENRKFSVKFEMVFMNLSDIQISENQKTIIQVF